MPSIPPPSPIPRLRSAPIFRIERSAQLQQILHREQNHVARGDETTGYQPTTAAHEVLRGLLLRESDVPRGRRAPIRVSASKVRQRGVRFHPQQER